MLASLYRFPPGAEHHPLWSPDRANGSGAAVQVTASWRNTQQLPYLLLNTAITALGGAAQYPTKWFHTMQYPGGGVDLITLCGGEFASTVAAQTNRAGFNFGSGILIPPRYELVAWAIFNAGVASNSVTLHLGGYYIPRGNIAFP